MSRQRPTFAFDPYFDHGRFPTPEGGLLIVYKDLDERLLHTIRRVVAWSLFTGFEGWTRFHQPPIHTLGIKFLCLIAAAIRNWLSAPHALHRQRGLSPRR